MKKKQPTIPTAAQLRAVLLTGVMLKDVLPHLPSAELHENVKEALDNAIQIARNDGYFNDIYNDWLGQFTLEGIVGTPEQAYLDALLVAKEVEEKEYAEYLARKAAKTAAQ